MATSSITHNFVVSNPNSVKRFIAAIDEADRDRTPKQTLPGRQLTNPQEILALIDVYKRQRIQLGCPAGQVAEVCGIRGYGRCRGVF